MSLDEEVNKKPGIFSTPLRAAKTGLIVGLISIPLTYIVDPENHKNGLEEFLKLTIPVALIVPVLLTGGVYAGQKIRNVYGRVNEYFK